VSVQVDDWHIEIWSLHAGRGTRDAGSGQRALGGTLSDPYIEDRTRRIPNPEIAMPAQLKGRKVAFLATDGVEQVELTEEAAILAEGYVSRGIFHRKFIADALHVAIASYHKIDYLVTWNFGHLANVRRQARIRLFNTAAGFYVPMIVTPEFLVSEATEKAK